MPFYNREKFNEVARQLAQVYHVADVEDMFDVRPPEAVRLMQAIMEKADFLSEITLIPVTDSKGQLVTMLAPGTIAGRTDTSGSAERVPQQVGALSGRDYEVKKTDFDVAYKYALIDAWARFPDFAVRLMTAIYRRQALDRLMIGWNGASCATTTDRTAHPLLDDVNFGWLYDLKTNKAENYLTEGATAGKIKLGAGGDYTCLDHLAYDLLSLIPEEHRTGREKLLVGREIVAWECGKIYEKFGDTPTEKLAIAKLVKQYAGLDSETPAAFPVRGVMVCDPAQLQLYYQDSAIRRQMIDNPKKDQIEHFQSGNECYRIDDLDAVVAVEAANVEFVTPSSAAQA